MWDNFKQSVINEVLERGGTGKYLKKITVAYFLKVMKYINSQIQDT